MAEKQSFPDLAYALLKKVKKRYLKSGDFNGFHVSATRNSRAEIIAAVELVKSGLVEVVGPSDYPNIHIRPWSPRRTVDAQSEELLNLTGDDYGVCLYPTKKTLKKQKLPTRFDDAPFSRAMARGCSTLELAFFSSDVLESYRNDARYMFGMGDFGINFLLSDEAYDNREVPNKDRVGLMHLGFAYDMRRYDTEISDSPIIRRVAAFYGDLEDLTPAHQQRWASYQVEDEGISPHPVWYGSQMGHWPDGVGPFERLTLELKSINDLFENVWNARLFRVHEPPEDFGWLLRADQREWDHFILSFDKMLSDNINGAALDVAGVPKKNERGDSIGTIGRLELFMTSNNVSPEQAKWAVKPIRDIRSARQKPAHILRTNVSDHTFIRKQRDLIHDVDEVLINIRQWLSSHPRNQDWKEPWPNAKDYPL
ncbi:hypothetical protein [Glutamicibacter protophormiae]|uniref:hypothetical protein n=1 Tax=Glutamicibacter protophormiae TaxID=37930 RepID=UPI00332A4466